MGLMQGRIEKTLERMRRGELPVPTTDRPSIETGTYRFCDGCRDPITPLERMSVVVIFQVAVLRFHDECYTAWSSFTR